MKTPLKNYRPLITGAVIAGIIVVLVLNSVAGNFSLWFWPGLMAVLLLPKLVALGSLVLFILLLNTSLKRAHLPPEDYEFTIQRDGRPHAFNVIPDELPEPALRVQKWVAAVIFLIGGGFVLLLPEWMAFDLTRQLWVLDNGLDHTGVVTHLREETNRARASRFYVAYTYWLPAEQQVEREQRISAMFYHQLTVGDAVTLRYWPEQPAEGYVVDPEWGQVFRNRFSFPLLLNAILGPLALVAVWRLIPEIWRRWRHARAAAF